MLFEATRLRRTVLDMAYAGSSVHIACAFSLIELLAVIYRSHLRLGKDPRAPDRDLLLLSKGHGILAQYACLRELGWVSDHDVQNYFHDGSRLKGLADAHVPGVEATGGSLGHGLSVGVGLALAAQRKETRQKIFVVVGDGEMNEGAIWEALLFAQHFRLRNLMVIVDANGYQAMGPTDEIMHLGSIHKKLETFGFECLEVDGHDEVAIDCALRSLTDSIEPRPKALVAHTVKGKGISFMHGRNAWHYTRLTAETYRSATQELDGHFSKKS